MRILGIHDGTHDAGAALVEDGRVVAASNEERYSRRKGDGGWPAASLAACLAAAPGPVDAVAFAGVANPNPVLRASRALQGRFRLDDGAFFAASPSASGRLAEWLQFESPFPRLQADHPASRALAPLVRAQLARTVRALGLDAPVFLHDHHLCHAASAWLTSGFDEGLVLVADGVGDGLALTAWEARGRVLRSLASRPYPHSHGLFYASVTALLGFRPFRHEGKLTGLAAHGDADAVDVPWPFSGPDDAPAFDLAFGAPLRDALSPLLRHRREDVCAWLQRGVERDLRRFAASLLARTGARDLALAGGLFANVRLNAVIGAIPGVARLHVFPHMGDGGLAVGAALASWAALAPGQRVPPPLGAPLLGPSPTAGDVAAVCRDLAAEGFHVERPPSMADAVADILARGGIVGRCAGRMELGPRALGNRSILAPADDPRVVTRLNAALARSDFMPFAPIVLEDALEAWTETPPALQQPARTMTTTVSAKPLMRARLPAVVHIDGTLRPQAVDAVGYPELRAILLAYRARTGLPALLNTSFNVHEEPIVATPAEAAATFRAARLDALVLEDALVTPRTSS